MKQIIVSLFLCTFVFASVESEISKYSQDLLKINANYSQMDRNLADTARKIVNAKKERILIDKEIATIEEELAQKRELHQQTRQLFVRSKEELEVLKQDKAALQAQMRDLIAKEFGLSMALENQDLSTKNSFIDKYVYEITSEYTNKKIKQLNESVIEIALKQEKLQKQNKEYEVIIADMQQKQNKLARSKKSLDALIAKLNDNQKAYKQRLARIEKEKSELAQTLNRLKIVAQEQKQQALEAKKEQERQRQLQSAAQTETTPALKRNDVDYEVRQIGSSYHHDNLYRYRGPKTISPIENAQLVRDFGTYVDPIYNIKIFNESIVLKAPTSPSNVRTVLNGEVLYAQETNMLGKVVIVKHSGDMHTIYAGLSKIAPGIKEGKKIAKGHVIGRVTDELTFEATKNSRHLNPSRLISLR